MQRFHFHSEWLNHFTRIVPILTQRLFCFAIQITSKHEQREPLWQFMRGNAATMVCFALFRAEIETNGDENREYFSTQRSAHSEADRSLFRTNSAKPGSFIVRKLTVNIDAQLRDFNFTRATHKKQFLERRGSVKSNKTT